MLSQSHVHRSPTMSAFSNAADGGEKGALVDGSRAALAINHAVEAHLRHRRLA